MGLTPREIEIFKTCGKWPIQSKYCGATVFLSQGTVKKNYISNLYSKIGVKKNRSAAIHYWKVRKQG
ncbi:hypothetical protein GCM10020331_056590 [Ectobacillus funiculus]